MGSVVVAFDRDIRREVALKVALATSSDPAELARFVQEAQVTGQLEHPNIVPIHELGRTPDGTPYFTMKIVRGELLAVRLDAVRDAITRRESPARVARTFPLVERLAIFQRVCDALAFAHAHGVIHRDLKPDNVMVSAFGEVQVLDWGLARLVGATSGTSSEPPTAVATSDRAESGDVAFQTQDGAIAGTLAYMAPEQANGKVAEQDARTDVFALGALLYELLSLTAPYHGAGAYDVLLLAADARWQPVSERVASAWRGRLGRPPRELAAIAEKAMAREPTDRYASVQELQADVRAYQSFQPIGACRDSVAARCVKWSRRHPRLTLAAAMVAVASLAVALVALQWHTAIAGKQLAEERQRRAQAEADVNSQRALLSQAAEAAARGELDQVRRVLREHLSSQRDDVLQRFHRDWAAAQAARKSQREFVAAVSAATLAVYRSAFDALIDTSSRTQYIPSVDDWHWRALLSYFLEDYARCVADYDRALELDPNLSGARLNRGIANLKLGREAQALADFDLALALDPDDPEAYSSRAVTRHRLGDLQGAIADWDVALRLQPNRADAYAWRGAAKQRVGDVQGALADLDRALELGPESALAYFNRAVCKRALGDSRGAIADLDRALRLDPSSAEAYNNRGSAKEAVGEARDAIADFDAALRLKPSYALALMNRGVAKMALNSPRDAIADLDAAVEMGLRSAQVYHHRGNAKYQLKDLEGAIADWNLALELDPRYARAYFNRAVAKEGLDDVRGAIADLDQVLELDPRDASAWFRRGRVKLAQGNARQAVADLDAGLRIEPSNASALANRGAAKESLGDLRAALDDFDAALARAPTLVAVRANRGRLRRELGDVAGAIADYDAVLAADPRDAVTLFNRGNARVELADDRGAIDDFSAALHANPRLWQARAMRGQLRARHGEKAAGLADLEEALGGCDDAGARQGLEEAVRELAREVGK